MIFWSPLYDYIEEANGQYCMINIVYRLRLIRKLAGSSPENIVSYYSLSFAFEPVKARKLYFNLA